MLVVLIQIVPGVPRLADEEWPQFIRRRSRNAAGLIEMHSDWWSRQWFVRAKSWDDHLVRDFQRQLNHFVDGVCVELVPSNFSWASALRFYRDATFLEANRVYFFQDVLGGRLSSRTGLRAGRGKVHTRWHEGVDHAKRMSN